MSEELPIIAYNPKSMLEKIKAAWWCLTGRCVTIAIIIPFDRFYKKEPKDAS